MQNKLGIRSKLLLPLILGLVVIVIVLFFFWHPSQLVAGKKDYIAEQQKILKTLTPSLVQNILSNDLAALHTILENSIAIHKEHWRHLQLNDPDNKRLYPVFSGKIKKTDTTLKIKITIEEENEIFGYLILHTDWEIAKNKKIKFSHTLGELSILLFCLIAVVSYVLQTKWIYKPITTLKDITSKFSQGNYSSKLPEVTKDEIGQLTISIGHMRNTIQSTLDEVTNKEKMTRAILETAPDAIITMDKEGVINSFNPGAEKIFQYPKNEVLGKSINMLMPEDISQHHNQYLKKFSIGSSLTLGKDRELTGIRKNGSEFPIEITINANIIEGKHLFTGILRDITERKKIELLKSEFVATVSHELRTPLTAIKGSLDLITKGMELDLPEEADTMLILANRNVERLLTLINDILDVSKFESGEISFLYEKLKLKPFIKDTLAINQEYAKKYNTTFECKKCHKDITINADRDRLVQVMSNLLSNAAKYSPKNVPVEIFTTVIKDTVRVSIKDHGPGIPKDFQDKVFGKFTQSSSGDTRQVGGTGLGLNISKMIVEKLGGQIGFETIEGKETTFYFELPIVEKN